MTRKEAGIIAEILTEAALREGRNVMVDGSLKDLDWYQRYFERLRRKYSKEGNNLRIGILHITAPRDAIIERARVRYVLLFVIWLFDLAVVTNANTLTRPQFHLTHAKSYFISGLYSTIISSHVSPSYII